MNVWDCGEDPTAPLHGNGRGNGYIEQMSSLSSGSGSSNSFDVDELLQIQARSLELRKEKNMLRESKSQSFELIRVISFSCLLHCHSALILLMTDAEGTSLAERLEAHVKTLSEVHFKDKKHIQELERELSNCSQEIGSDPCSDCPINYLRSCLQPPDQYHRGLHCESRGLWMNTLAYEIKLVENPKCCLCSFESVWYSTVPAVKWEIASLGALKTFGLCLADDKLMEVICRILSVLGAPCAGATLFNFLSCYRAFRLKLFISIMIFLPDYLQDQLHARNAEVNSLRDHVHSLELKLTDIDKLEDIVGSVSKELQRSNSELLILTRKLESKEEELQKSTLRIEKLEESIASVALEYQCEIESMKLDLLAFEHSCFEANKIQEEAAQEKSWVHHLIQDFELQIQDYREVIERLDEENRELREKLNIAEVNAKGFCQKMEETFPELMETKNALSSSSEFETNTSTCGDILGPLLSRPLEGRASDAELKEKLEEMSCQIHEYELLVTKLKEELREEKVKSREEAEDLTQEMAELRYQISGLLEEECKRRACIEQISLQRIAKLEAQVSSDDIYFFLAYLEMRIFSDLLIHYSLFL
ncbi:hypothetical protein RJ639_045154 [Escallonia herrerae]|uniref:Uncharacterized protein n=1 Tax=Escallonia herrerae TaxID=1293975 RepID=A0AA88W7J3_9ASTE|nr:hypothetical protein RJ639_045154 [Escallonia herrerae]